MSGCTSRSASTRSRSKAEVVRVLKTVRGLDANKKEQHGVFVPGDWVRFDVQPSETKPGQMVRLPADPLIPGTIPKSNGYSL